MKFSENDLKEIKEFAMFKFNSDTLSVKNERYFLTKCFVDAIISFLIKNNYEIIKKQKESDDQQRKLE